MSWEGRDVPVDEGRHHVTVSADVKRDERRRAAEKRLIIASGVHVTT